MKKIINEFKNFALKGNMLDLAIGLIIGTAFGVIVKSLVDDIIMPLISFVFGQPDFSNLFLVLRNKTGQEFTSIQVAKEAGVIVLGYGQFLNALVAFIISALALFLVIKSINKMKEQFVAKKESESEQEMEKETNKSSTEAVLLSEIRDLLKNK